MPRDPELERAIARGKTLLGPGVAASQVVHRLALRGADALEADAATDAAGRDLLHFDRLAEVLSFESQWVAPAGSLS